MIIQENKYYSINTSECRKNKDCDTITTPNKNKKTKGMKLKKTLKELIQTIHAGCKEHGRSDEFFHRAIIFLMEWELDFSMAGNGWLDNDPETLNAISEDDDQVNEFNQFFKEIGIIGWYNRE